MQDGVQDEGQVDWDERGDEEGEDLKWRNESDERKSVTLFILKSQNAFNKSVKIYWQVVLVDEMQLKIV